LAFSLDATTLYGIGSYTADTGLPKSYVSAWNAQTGVLVWETEISDGSMDGALTLSVDGSIVATAGSSIHLWRASDGSQLPLQAKPTTGFNTVALSPNGQDFVLTHWSNDAPDPQVIGPDGVVIWGAPVGGSSSGCQSGVFSPDGTRVAAACDLELKIWNAQTGTLIRSLKVAGPVY